MTEKELVKTILKYRDAYWSGNSLVDDSTYDDLIETLRKINPNNEILTQIETGKIKGKTVNHTVPMLSLQKVYTKDNLYKWMKTVARNDGELFLIQPKYDGISCHCDHEIYSTRGDGKIGQDITEILIGLHAVVEFEENRDIVNKPDFYGEIVIKNSDFNTIYKNIKNNTGNTFKTQRNAVAGIFGVDDYTFYAKQGAKVTLVDYDKYSFPCKLKEFDMKWDMISQIITNLDYPMDGIVVKIADEYYSKMLGNTEHHPRGNIAFKFENVSKWTVMRDVNWGMGKGQITATALFDPIEINGVKIIKAVIPMASDSLPNIMNGDFTLGTKLLVERAGDVIPHIIKVETNKNEEPFFLEKCPWCGSKIVVDRNTVYCENPNCEEKLIQSIYYSLVTLGCKNIGEGMVRLIYNMPKINPIRNIKDFINFVTSSEGRNIIKNTPGFGDVSSNNIYREIISIKSNNSVAVLASLNIPNLGKKVAGVLMEKYKTIDNLFSGSTKYTELINLPGIGEIMADRIFKCINDIQFSSYVKDYVSWFELNISSQTGNITKKGKVCFTGAMMYERKKMFDIARKAGFEPIDSVTKDCNILVMADTNSMSTKAQKARKMGITIMTDKEFINECQKTN